MSNLFSFEQTPWELTLETLRQGGSFSAVRFLTLLEGEDEQAVEDAFQSLEDLSISLDISELPRPSFSGETGKRLAMEEKLVQQGNLLNGLSEGDPLRLYLEELAGIPAFGDINLLALELAECNSREETEAPVQMQLVNLSLSRVVELAGEYTGWGVLLMDLIQEGSLGLWQGILAYIHGLDFETVRDWWIRQYMARAVVLQARQAGVGQKMRKALEDYRSADRKLLTQLGRNPTVEEIALEMGVGGEEAQVYEQMLRSVQLLASANAPKKEPEQEDDQAVEDTAYFQSRQRILDMLSSLTPQQAQVVSLRFGLEGGLPLTPEQTGQKLGLTPQQVVEMEAAALAALRKENG